MSSGATFKVTVQKCKKAQHPEAAIVIRRVGMIPKEEATINRKFRASRAIPQK